MSPVDRYNMLPEYLRSWIEELRKDDLDRLDDLRRFSKEDIAEIREAMKFARSARTLGRFGRGAVVFLVGGFTAAVLAGEKIAIAWKWMTGAAK